MPLVTRGFLSSLAAAVVVLGVPSAALAQACLGLHASRPVATGEVISNFQRDGITGPSSVGLSLTTGRLFATVETGADLASGESALAARNGLAGSLGVTATRGRFTSCVGGALARSEAIGATTTGATAVFGGAAIRLPSLPMLPLSAFGVATYERRTTESTGLDDLTASGMVYRVGVASYPFPWLGLRVYEDRFDEERRTGFSVGITLPLRGQERTPGPAPVPQPAPQPDVQPEPAPAPTPAPAPAPAPAPVPEPPKDADGDGVIDAQDRCPNTPAGTQVGANGCPLDSDGDGVIDAQDNCPNTPAGTKVGANGCPLDADGDGVVDTQDQCLDSPAGAEVDARGCPKLFAAAASFTLTGVTFETSSAVIRPTSFGKLDEVAAALQANPEVRVEISGHTDAVGSDESNQRLSQARAESVRAYLIGKGVAADRMEARGFGESRPVAPNETPEGRAENRRVEMRRLP